MKRKIDEIHHNCIWRPKESNSLRLGVGDFAPGAFTDVAADVDADCSCRNDDECDEDAEAESSRPLYETGSDGQQEYFQYVFHSESKYTVKSLWTKLSIAFYLLIS